MSACVCVCGTTNQRELKYYLFFKVGISAPTAYGHTHTHTIAFVFLLLSVAHFSIFVPLEQQLIDVDGRMLIERDQRKRERARAKLFAKESVEKKEKYYDVG